LTLGIRYLSRRDSMPLLLLTISLLQTSHTKRSCSKSWTSILRSVVLPSLMAYSCPGTMARISQKGACFHWIHEFFFDSVLSKIHFSRFLFCRWSEHLSVNCPWITFWQIPSTPCESLYWHWEICNPWWDLHRANCWRVQTKGHIVHSFVSFYLAN